MDRLTEDEQSEFCAMIGVLESWLDARGKLGDSGDLMPMDHDHKIVGGICLFHEMWYSPCWCRDSFYRR